METQPLQIQQENGTARYLANLKNDSEKQRFEREKVRMEFSERADIREKELIILKKISTICQYKY